jgi:hypothetical protein
VFECLGSVGYGLSGYGLCGLEQSFRCTALMLTVDTLVRVSSEGWSSAQKSYDISCGVHITRALQSGEQSK